MHTKRVNKPHVRLGATCPIWQAQHTCAIRRRKNATVEKSVLSSICLICRAHGLIKKHSTQQETDRCCYRQYRSNWNVDPSTGHYNSTIPSPTGIVADPALASYGVAQAKQLGSHLLQVSPPVDKIYSSPFYRCIQTLQPFTTARHEKNPGSGVIHVEPGVGEFYGLARFDHPSPAPIEELRRHFPHLKKDEKATIIPSTKVISAET